MDLSALLERRHRPVETHEIRSADIKHLREYGRQVEHSWRVAVTRIGSVMWELIDSLGQEGIYGRFLAEKGEVAYHVVLATSKVEELVASQLEEGHELVGSGELGGTRVAYLATDRDLGVITEIFSGAPSADAAPD